MRPRTPLISSRWPAPHDERHSMETAASQTPASAMGFSQAGGMDTGTFPRLCRKGAEGAAGHREATLQQTQGNVGNSQKPRHKQWRGPG